MRRPMVSVPASRWLVRRLGRLIIAGLAMVVTLSSPADAHRSGCHRWHSCPSDRGTYVCGDLGYCSGCPDNKYCLLSKPRGQTDRPVATPPSDKGTQPSPERTKPGGPK